MFCCPVLPTDEQVQRLSTELILSLPVLNRDVFCCYIFLFDHAALTEGHTQGHRNRGAGPRPPTFQKTQKMSYLRWQAPFALVKNVVQIAFYMIAIIFPNPPPPRR